MSIARVTEITCSSSKGFDDAIRDGIQRANKTLDKIKGAWIQEQTVTVKDGKVDEFRVNMKVSFVLRD